MLPIVRSPRNASAARLLHFLSRQQVLVLVLEQSEDREGASLVVTVRNVVGDVSGLQEAPVCSEGNDFVVSDHVCQGGRVRDIDSFVTLQLPRLLILFDLRSRYFRVLRFSTEVEDVEPVEGGAGALSVGRLRLSLGHEAALHHIRSGEGNKRWKQEIHLAPAGFLRNSQRACSRPHRLHSVI
eukprot:756346-Hanusia_phi.AAC.1